MKKNVKVLKPAAEKSLLHKYRDKNSVFADLPFFNNINHFISVRTYIHTLIPIYFIHMNNFAY